MRCKVIATWLGPRSQRGKSVYPYHRQNITTAEAAKKMLSDVVNAESSNVQLIVVNNRSNNENEKWLRRNLPSHVILECRENDGGSFGAYNYAFQKYRDQFNWWMFTEDDIIIGGHGYYDKYINRFIQTERCGMVAAVGVDNARLHAHGGVGLTHREVLEEVCCANEGMLPYPLNMGWRRNEIELLGEIRFTNIMTQIGFQLVPFGDNRSWDWQNNLCLPYLNWVEAGRPQ